MASSSRPPVRRGPSGAWSRLRTAPIDPLEAYGLPSKGETRLSEAKTQESYFETIVSRYMKFCASCGSGDKLEEAFASLTLDAASTANSSVAPPRFNARPSNPPAPSATIRPPLSSTNTCPTPIPQSQPPSFRQPSSTLASKPTNIQQHPLPKPAQNELPTLLMAMRKLREGIVSLKRTDAFAQRVYMFITRTTIHPFQHYESYHPSLLYLLQKIHPITPLAPSELQEFTSYLILDLACRQGDLHEALRIKNKYKSRDWKVEKILKSIVRDDWMTFWQVRRQVDGGLRVLMAWYEPEMRKHALACLARTYLSADKAFVEKCADRGWEGLVKDDGVGWVLEPSGAVTIRRVKAK